MHRLFNNLYKSSLDGLSGNDDLGAMGSFYVFWSIVLFPMIPGVGGLTINAPQFEEIMIHLSKGDLTIKGGDNHSYIQSMKLNGKNYNSSWINWSQIEKGGKIEYQLTTNPKPKWAIDSKLPSFNSL